MEEKFVAFLRFFQGANARVKAPALGLNRGGKCSVGFPNVKDAWGVREGTSRHALEGMAADLREPGAYWQHGGG